MEIILDLRQLREDKQYVEEQWGRLSLEIERLYTIKSKLQQEWSGRGFLAFMVVYEKEVERFREAEEGIISMIKHLERKIAQYEEGEKKINQLIKSI